MKPLAELDQLIIDHLDKLVIVGHNMRKDVLEERLEELANLTATTVILMTVEPELKLAVVIKQDLKLPTFINDFAINGFMAKNSIRSVLLTSRIGVGSGKLEVTEDAFLTLWYCLAASNETYEVMNNTITKLKGYIDTASK